MGDAPRSPETDDGWENGIPPAMPSDVLLLDIDGFEGPIDLLLTLARDQKVDLRRISILQLAEQYLLFVAEARRRNLELAADYLVMAAWLAYLKSRLLIPEAPGEEEPSGAEMAAALAFHLQRLDAMRKAGAALFARPRLGESVFARGAPEGLRDVTRPIYDLRLYDLLSAYGAFHGRKTETRLEIGEAKLYSVDEALARLSYLIGAAADWQKLEAFLPPGLADPLYRRSAIGATLVAALELVRQGRIVVRQDGGAFSPIRLRKAP
ncbi:segregation and condensation protein A [Oleispirillum naphthae]|uniref:segregation and condensation protein A n=1 Tax=Oleispirillum naphthae TaxID=2838853 RepID=UPI003B683994